MEASRLTPVRSSRPSASGLAVYESTYDELTSSFINDELSMSSKPAARVARPASRYWRGKGNQAAAAESSGSSDSENEGNLVSGDARGNRKLTEEELAKKEGIVIKKDITLVSQQPIKEISEEEESEEDEQDTKPTFRRPAATAAAGLSNDVPAVHAVAPGQQEESEYETDSEEESSEEEVAQPLYKPVFVSKRNRDTKANGAIDTLSMTPEQLEELELKRQEEMEEQRKQAHALVAETVKRSLAEKEVKETFPDVDDTDGLDGATEFEDWKLRELTRIKRDADALYAREKEQNEVEERRAMPEALRLKEDLERASKQREEAKANRGQQGLLAKYHHRGAFYAEEEIVNRNTTGTVMEDSVRDVESLPAIMQVRDYGKRSRTKHTHLADVDTTSRDAGWSRQPRAGASGDKHAVGLGGSYPSGGNPSDGNCFFCGMPGHVKKDCPQMAEEQTAREARNNRGGPRKNAFGMDRNPNNQEAASNRSREWGKHDDVRDDRHLREDRGRSRSRSPPRRRRDDRSRSRSRSRDRSLDRMRKERDKRRRVD